MKRYCHLAASNKQLDLLDKEIILILDTARRQVEGPKRGVPYSISKLKAFSTVMYWTAKVKLQQGKNINLQAMEKRLLDAEIEDNTSIKEQVLAIKKKAIEDQKEVVLKKKLRDIKVLDINSIVIEGDNDKTRRI